MPPGVVALILGEVVDEPIYGDVPLVQGLLVIGIIAAWHWVNSWLSYRSIWLDRLLGSGPTTLRATVTSTRAAAGASTSSGARKRRR